MSKFDPQMFLDAVITEVQVKRPPLPAGMDFVATIGEPVIRPWQGKKDPTQSGIAADIPMLVDTTSNPSWRAPDGYPPSVSIKYGIMLDTTESGMIDLAPGKNGKLRAFREALGLNAPGAPFSFRAVQGRNVKVKISHREYEGDLFDDIAAVAKA